MGNLLLSIDNRPTLFTRFVARGLSAVLVLIILILLNQTQNLKIMFERDEQIANVTVVKIEEIPIPKPKIVPPEKLKKKQAKSSRAQIPNISDRLPKNLNLPSIAVPTPTIPHIATNNAAPPSRAPPATPQTPASAGLRRALWLQACNRVDVAERPPDCPVTDTAKRAVAAASAPKYNPDRVQGHSRAEIVAKKSAGWRDRCETESGGRASVCIPFGRTPTQVKTPYKICMERGLSNCRPPPSQYDDPILGFGNQQ
jgi:hypothetical protein